VMRLGEAVMLLACIQGATIATPLMMPTDPSHISVHKIEVAPTATKSAAANCSSQTWPNLTQACLRNPNADRGAQRVRIVAIDRQ
jgi:hypothetical protein